MRTKRLNHIFLLTGVSILFLELTVPAQAYTEDEQLECPQCIECTLLGEMRDEYVQLRDKAHENYLDAVGEHVPLTQYKEYVTNKTLASEAKTLIEKKDCSSIMDQIEEIKLELKKHFEAVTQKK